METLTIFLAFTRSKVARFITVSVCYAMVCACSNKQLLGQGTVLTEKQISPVDRTSETKTGAVAGTYIGTVLGALYGAVAGVGCTAVTFGACAPAVPGLVAGGMAAGGGVGGASGAAIGYAAGTYQQGKGLYHYTVRPLYDDRSTITVEQYSDAFMPEGTAVFIYKITDGKITKYRIEPIAPPDA